MINYGWIIAVCLVVLTLCVIPARADEVPAGSKLREIARSMNLEGRVMWMDATANIKTLQTREGVRNIIAKCKKANINTIVLDVKPIVGQVMYRSYVAPKLTEWKRQPYPRDYDLLQTVLEEAHAVGISVYPAVNVFAEGHKNFSAGPGYSKVDWQSVVYLPERSVSTDSGQSFSVTANPNEAPAAKSLTVWTTNPKDRKSDELWVVVSDGQVTATAEGDSIKSEGLPIPEGGYALVGIGDGREWLQKNAPIGAKLKLEVRPDFKPIAEANVGGWAVFVNPVHSQARAYELSLIREILELYPVDGIALDRMRYANIYTDFSDISRRKFERWLNKPIENWPQDIYTHDPIPGKSVIPGKYYKEWLEWRAYNIQQFLASVDAARRVIRPQAKLAVYVGSWYSSYYNEGVNWASENYNAGCDWMTPTYPSTGYAQMLDFLMVGAYYKHATREEAKAAGEGEEFSVQAATEGSVQVVNDATWVYGGLYVLDYKGNPDGFERAVEAARNAGEGVMLFDLVYVEDYNWWPILEKLFADPKKAPHDITNAK